MKVIGLDGKEYDWKIEFALNTNPSSLHLKARTLIKEIFPHHVLYEEILIPGKIKIRLDFLMLWCRKAIEVQGEQHFKFNGKFFENKFEFLKAKQRDKLKRQWCNLNGIELIELLYNESLEEWKKKIIL